VVILQLIRLIGTIGAIRGWALTGLAYVPRGCAATSAWFHHGRTALVGLPHKPALSRLIRAFRRSGDAALGGGSAWLVLLTYQLYSSVRDMLWCQRVQRIRVRSWRVGL